MLLWTVEFAETVTGQVRSSEVCETGQAVSKGLICANDNLNLPPYLAGSLNMSTLRHSISMFPVFRGDHNPSET